MAAVYAMQEILSNLKLCRPTYFFRTSQFSNLGNNKYNILTRTQSSITMFFWSKGLIMIRKIWKIPLFGSTSSNYIINDYTVLSRKNFTVGSSYNLSMQAWLETDWYCLVTEPFPFFSKMKACVGISNNRFLCCLS